WSTVRSSSSFSWQYGWQGLRFDTSVGLVTNRENVWNLNTDTWNSPDRLGFGAGYTDLYMSRGDQPVNRVDPSGLQQGLDNKILATVVTIEATDFNLRAMYRIAWGWAEEAKDYSESIAKKYSKCPGIDAERVANAVRHAYWMGLLTARYGPDIAKSI